MNKVHVFLLSLATVLAGPVHAQVCSGGKDGGMDATGNQCNAPNDVAAFATGSAVTSSTQVTKIFSVWGSAPAARSSIRLAKTSGQNSAPTTVAVPASRKVRTATSPNLSAKTAKTAAESETF